MVISTYLEYALDISLGLQIGCNLWFCNDQRLYMNNRIKFTKRKIESLPLPEKDAVVYHDTETAGFKLRLSKAGIYTFFINRKIKGKAERIKLGNFPAMTVEQARTEAGVINGLIAKGINPNNRLRSSRAEFTLGELFNEYLESHAKPHKKSWPSDVSNYKNHLIHWQNKKLSDVLKKDINALHSKIKKNSGLYQANRVLALLAVMFNKAINDLELFNGKNPTIGIKKFKEVSRDRFLQPDELQKFFEAVADEENETIRDYILISLLTGARRSNILAMQWKEISFDRAEWRIPETKNGESHTVPLTIQVVQLLNKRKALKTSRFVFHGSGKTGHLVEPKKGWIRIKERAGIEDLRLHDLRRTLGSWQATTGASLPIIGKTLAHKNVSTTAIYARLNNDPVRESMEKATSAMMNAGKPKADVVPIKQQK